MRDWRSSDVDPYDEHCNTEEVLEHIYPVMSRSKLKQEIEWFKEQQVTHGHTFWALERKSDEQLLGFCGLVVADDGGKANSVLGELEVGWRLRKDAWNNGYAKEAARAALNFAFKELAARRVVSRVSPRNSASWGLMRALGMKHDYSLDYGSGDDRLHVYTIEWSEWANRQ